jgi:hypothetical protein
MADISGDIGMNLTTPDSQQAAAPQTNRSSRISAQELHKYVWGLVGVFMAIVITYPMAMDRVSKQGKMIPYQSHLRSLDKEYKPVQPNQ